MSPPSTLTRSLAGMTRLTHLEGLQAEGTAVERQGSIGLGGPVPPPSQLLPLRGCQEHAILWKTRAHDVSGMMGLWQTVSWAGTALQADRLRCAGRTRLPQDMLEVILPSGPWCPPQRGRRPHTFEC